MKYFFLTLVIVGVIEWLKKFFTDKIKGSKWMPLISAVIATTITVCYTLYDSLDLKTIVCFVVIEIAITQVFYDIIYKTLLGIKKAVTERFNISDISRASANLVMQFLTQYGIIKTNTESVESQEEKKNENEEVKKE